MKSNFVQKTSIMIMIVTLLSKMIGFGREIIFSYYFGTSTTADAYIFSLTVSTIIFGFIGNGITTSFVPMYLKICKNDGKDRAHEFTSNLIIGYILVCIVILVILYPNTEWIVRFLASGFDDTTVILSSLLCKYSLMTVIASGLTGIYCGILQINDNYWAPAARGLSLNLLLIISVVIASKANNTNILGMGNMLAVYAEMFFLLIWIPKNEKKLRISNVLHDKYIAEIVALAIPIILSASVNQINVLFDKSLASNMNGGIATLNYAHTIIGIVNDVIVTSIIAVMYPKISSAYVKNNQDDITQIFAKSMSTLLYIIIPIAMMMLITSRDIIDFFYGRGAFDNNAIFNCSRVLLAYTVGIPFVAIRQMLIRIFYACHNTKTPVINASIAIVINIILNIPFMNKFGIPGLALATSVSAIIADILLWYSLNKKIKLKMTQDFICKVGKILICGLLEICIMYYLSSKINFICIEISLMLKFALGLIVYFILTVFMKANLLKNQV